ncbi:Uncharacterised protein [Chlamydia trachomatis]|nr:Uncharacterised protein [Chlamydia trachomatis]
MLVFLDERIGGGNDVLGRAIVLLQLKGFELGILLFKPQNVANVGTSK